MGVPILLDTNKPRTSAPQAINPAPVATAHDCKGILLPASTTGKANNSRKIPALLAAPQLAYLKHTRGFQLHVPTIAYLSVAEILSRARCQDEQGCAHLNPNPPKG